MSDYELASLFADYLANLEDTFINYISVMFAFLVAGFLAARKLNTLMISVVIVLYGSFALNQILSMAAVATDLRGLESLMAERIAQGSEELKFHSGAQSPFIGQGLGVTGFFAMVGGFFGSVWFFFLQRAEPETGDN